MSKYQIILADDQILFREELKKIIAGTPQQAIVGEAGSGCELFYLLGSLAPDMVILR